MAGEGLFAKSPSPDPLPKNSHMASGNLGASVGQGLPCQIVGCYWRQVFRPARIAVNRRRL
jgi:hypothetical protein